MFWKLWPLWLVNIILILSTIFVISHLLIAKMSLEWRLNLGFGAQKQCPFLLNRGVPRTEVTNTKIMWTFFQDQILRRCPLNRGVPKERFQCTINKWQQCKVDFVLYLVHGLNNESILETAALQGYATRFLSSSGSWEQVQPALWEGSHVLEKKHRFQTVLCTATI